MAGNSVIQRSYMILFSVGRAQTKKCCLSDLTAHLGYLNSQISVCHRPCWSFWCRNMAGHSKWQNIKHTKGAKDAERSTRHGKIFHQLRLAIKFGGPNPESNIELAHCIEQAKKNDVPKSKVEDILKAATSSKDQIQSHLLELQGPGRCVIIMEVATDNLKKLKNDMSSGLRVKYKTVWMQGGGSKYAFNCHGLLEVAVADMKEEVDMDNALGAAIEAGAEDVAMETDDDGNKCLRFITSELDLYAVKKELQKKYPIRVTEKVYTPSQLASLSTADLKIVEKLLTKMEEFEEINNLQTNIDNLP